MKKKIILIGVLFMSIFNFNCSDAISKYRCFFIRDTDNFSEVLLENNIIKVEYEIDYQEIGNEMRYAVICIKNKIEENLTIIKKEVSFLYKNKKLIVIEEGSVPKLITSDKNFCFNFKFDKSIFEYEIGDVVNVSISLTATNSYGTQQINKDLYIKLRLHTVDMNGDHLKIVE